MSSKNEINLLPLQFRQRIAIRQTFGGWLWAAAGMATVCGVQIAAVYGDYQSRREQVASLHAESQPVLSSLQNRDALRGRHQELLGLRNRIDALIPADDLLQTLGAIATATVDEASVGTTRVQALRIDLSGAAPASIAPSPSAVSPASHVALTAVAPDEAGLNQLIARLRRSERFRDVRLRGTAEHDASGGRRAEVEAEVLVQKELPE